MSRLRRYRGLGLLLAVLACGAALAQDRRFAVAEDWPVDSGHVAVGTDRVAYSGYQMDGPEGEPPRIVRSRVFQRIGDRTVTTDFNSRCSVLAHSPKGDLLLAQQIDPAAGYCCTCPTRPILIDSRGEVVMRLPYGLMADFSTTGEKLCAQRVRDEALGDRIELYDMKGGPVRVLEPGPFRRAIVLGDGSELVLLDDEGVRRIRIREDGRSHTRWSVALPPPRPPDGWALPYSAYANSAYLAPDKILVSHAGQRLAVIDFDGVVVFEYDAQQLAAESQGRDIGSRRIHRVRPGPPDHLWLTRGDGDYLVDLARGVMRPIKVDRTPPVDLATRYSPLLPSESPEHLIFVGQRELVLRPLLLSSP